MYLKKSSCLAIAIYQIEIMKLYLKQLINIYIKFRVSPDNCATIKIRMSATTRLAHWISISFSYNTTKLIPKYDS